MLLRMTLLLAGLADDMKLQAAPFERVARNADTGI